MKKETVILIAEDDEGHANLIIKNLERAKLANTIKHFRDGQETLDFLLKQGDGPHRNSNTSYLLLLDIRMPKVDGITILEKLKENSELRKMPVIMITTTDDPHEIERCHMLGCSNYITKPIAYDKFAEVIRRLGLFLLVVEVPDINGALH